MRATITKTLEDSALREAALAFVIRVASAGLAYCVQILLARSLHLEDYGVYAALWTWSIVASHLAVCGFSESSLRFLPRYMERGRTACAAGFVHTGFKAVIAGSMILTAAGLALIWVLGAAVPAIYLAGLIVVCLGLPLLAIELYLEGVCRSFGWFALGIVPGYLIRPLLIGTAVLLWAFAGNAPDAAFVLAVAVGVTGALSIIQALIVYRRLGPRTPKPVIPVRAGLWVRASLPLMLVNGIEELFIASDVLLVGLLGTPDQVAVYFAAVRSMALVNFVFYAFMLVSPRRFSAANAQQNRHELQETIAASTRWTFWLTLPAAALTLVAGYPLLGLFGPEYQNAFPVMAILALGYIARASVGPAADLLVVLGFQRASLLISAATLGTNVVLTIILFAPFGVLGVAAATSLSLALRAAAIAYVARTQADLSVFIARTSARRSSGAGEPVALPS